MRMHELAEPAMEVVRTGQVRFHPERWGRVYLDWLENIRPWCISRQLWWGHRLPVWYCDKCEETFVSIEAPERCGLCDGELRREEDVLDTWFSSALWPFATLGWPADTPELRAFYPTDVLVTARDIIFLWVARMVMMGMEFMHDVPFTDVDITSIIQAPDGRRMSKSLGTGIDPLDEIEAHGADAVRFGLLAMSSSQDVRYSAEKIQQGQQLANKMWNASRLVLLNAADVEPAPRPRTAEDRWILSRLQRAIARWREQVGAYDLSHAALDLYTFFYGDFCDWYLELVKPRLYEHEEEVSATVLHVLGQTLALAHPMLPFVTEEIHSFMPGAERDLAVSPFPEADESLLDEDAERELEAVIEAVRRLRNYRDSVGAATVCANSGAARGRSRRRSPGCDRPARAVRHRPRDGRDGEVVSSIGLEGATVEVLPSDTVDPAEARARIEAERDRLRAEIERARGKLANKGFTDKAPPQLVQTEREKLERFEAELAELEASSVEGRPAPAGACVARRRALPRLARDVRDALRARAHAPADDRARLAARALPLHPRAGVERQVLDGQDDRRAAGAPRTAHRRVPVAAPGFVGRADRGRGPPRVRRATSRRRSRASQRPPRSWTAPSRPATA